MSEINPYKILFAIRDKPKSDGWVISDFVDPKVMRKLSPKRMWWESFSHPESKPDVGTKILMRDNTPIAGMIIVDLKYSPFASVRSMQKHYMAVTDGVQVRKLPVTFNLPKGPV